MKKTLSIVLSLVLVLMLSLSVSAIGFVPSIEQKPFPEVVPEVDDKGNGYFGIEIKDGKRTPIPVGKLVVSSLDKRSNIDRNMLSSGDKSIIFKADEKLQAAYKEMLESKNLKSLFPSAEFDENTTYVVSHLFDISPVGTEVERLEKLFKDGGELEVDLKLGLRSTNGVIVATKCGDEWEVLDKSQVSMNSDGSTRLTFKELCPVAVIQPAKNADPGVVSPQTNDIPVFAILACGCTVAAIGMLVIGIKKKEIAE